MTIKRVCFSHGQESDPWGTKIRALAATAQTLGWSVDSLDYQGMPSPEDRTDKLVAYCQRQSEPVALVGSSMGGYVAMAAASRVGALGLFLLAPAFFLPDYEEILPAPPECLTTIIHGWRDDVVPWQGSARYGENTGAQLILLDGDHRLTSNIEVIKRLFETFLQSLIADD